MMWPQGRPMDEAPRDGTHILILDEYGNFHVVYWNAEDYFGKPFGWTYDGGDRFSPVKWWPLPPA